jgi:hypothetical protein
LSRLSAQRQLDDLFLKIQQAQSSEDLDVAMCALFDFEMDTNSTSMTKWLFKFGKHPFLSENPFFDNDDFDNLMKRAGLLQYALDKSSLNRRFKRFVASLSNHVDKFGLQESITKEQNKELTGQDKEQNEELTGQDKEQESKDPEVQELLTAPATLETKGQTPAASEVQEQAPSEESPEQFWADFEVWRSLNPKEPSKEAKDSMEAWKPWRRETHEPYNVEDKIKLEPWPETRLQQPKWGEKGFPAAPEVILFRKKVYEEHRLVSHETYRKRNPASRIHHVNEALKIIKEFDSYCVELCEAIKKKAQEKSIANIKDVAKKDLKKAYKQSSQALQEIKEANKILKEARFKLLDEANRLGDSEQENVEESAPEEQAPKRRRKRSHK